MVSNTAIAVNPKVTYVVVKTKKPDSEENEILVLAQELAHVVGEFEVLQTITGKDLERTTYERPFDYVEILDSHFVVLADYVTTEDGTGLVHQSPAFGADDLQVCRAYGLPVVNPVLANGNFADEVPLIGGVFSKKQIKPLSRSLENLANFINTSPTNTLIRIVGAAIPL